MKVPDWLTLWYKKPEWLDIDDYRRMVNDESLVPRHRPASPARSFTAIPSRLSLDRVLDNKTCSPMSLQDFYQYLKHIEHSAENLEFYLWCVSPGSEEAFYAGERVPLRCCRLLTGFAGTRTTTQLIRMRRGIGSLRRCSNPRWSILSTQISRALPPFTRVGFRPVPKL